MTAPPGWLLSSVCLVWGLPGPFEPDVDVVVDDAAAAEPVPVSLFAANLNII